jgi:hypothetical protein
MVPSNPPVGVAVGEGGAVQPPITARPMIMVMAPMFNKYQNKYQNDFNIVVSFLP